MVVCTVDRCLTVFPSLPLCPKYTQLQGRFCVVCMYTRWIRMESCVPQMGGRSQKERNESYDEVVVYHSVPLYNCINRDKHYGAVLIMHCVAIYGAVCRL